MKELIDYLGSQSSVLMSAPLVFITVAVLVGGLAYAACRWRYEGIVELLRERLSSKDQQLDEYRERLHLSPATGSEFSKQSHNELQNVALGFVASLRDWLRIRRGQDSEQQHRQWVEMSRAGDDDARKALWDAHTGSLMRSSNSMNSEYESKFKVRAIVLRDELMSRVSHPEPAHIAQQMYEHPTNPTGMGMVADDLERLARLLG